MPGTWGLPSRCGGSRILTIILSNGRDEGSSPPQLKTQDLTVPSTYQLAVVPNNMTRVSRYYASIDSLTAHPLRPAISTHLVMVSGLWDWRPLSQYTHAFVPPGGDGLTGHLIFPSSINLHVSWPPAAHTMILEVVITPGAVWAPETDSSLGR
ncbi:hypothetical protein BGZ63DRAFT_381601 [Mariannaea sp. PMI_226]|nr:hypothetical protein BGZ63DRAFT_381601 [Mariannaea sp. PMI_226]